MAGVPTLRDLGFEQELDYPTVKVAVDRERAGVLGVTANDVAKSVVAGTSSSRYTSANYWADPKSGIGYQVQVEIPEQQMNSLEQVKNLPIARRTAQQIDLRNVASVTDGTALGEYDRYNMQRMLTLSANISGEDLGRAATHVQQAIRDAGKPPDRVAVTVRGQVQPMAEMFGGLSMGLLMAVGVILLLLTANFQSFRLSLAVGLTIPAVIAGVAIMLWLTRTTLNIQSFMGAIMAIGVAVANAILLVTFAERSRAEGREPWEAAIEGARSRLRPILMTSFARSRSAYWRLSARFGPLTATSIGVGAPKLITRLTMSLGSNEKRTPGNSWANLWRSRSFKSSMRIPVPGLSCTCSTASSEPELQR